jgi:phage terminase large subunit GpA-like protein
MFVDSGFRTDYVRQWCRERGASRTSMSKGWSGPSKAVIEKDRTWKFGVSHQFIGTHSAKADILGTFLNVDTPGAGYWHFAKHLSDEFFSGLTSEVAVSKKVKGHWEVQWELVTDRARNEVLDCAVYAYAAPMFLTRYDGINKTLERKERPVATEADKRAPDRVIYQSMANPAATAVSATKKELPAFMQNRKGNTRI